MTQERYRIRTTKGRKAIRDAATGIKQNLEFLIDYAIIHHPTRTMTERHSAPKGVVIVPTHREPQISILTERNARLPEGVQVIVHINDHPLGLHLNEITGYTHTLSNEMEVGVVDGHPHAIVPTYSISYGNNEPPPIFTKSVTLPDKTVLEKTYYVLGPVLPSTDGNVAHYCELYGPWALLAAVDTMLKGKMLNVLLAGTLKSLYPRIITIDTSHIRNLKEVNNQPFSIGRARALPVAYLLEQKVIPQITPIFWNDADTFFEPGTLQKTIEYYQSHPHISGAFFSRRVAVSDSTVDPQLIVRHAQSELANAMLWLTENDLYYMGGPQISSRLEAYEQLVQFTNPFCSVESCSGMDCDHPKGTYQCTILEMLANCMKDEDFSFASALIQTHQQSALIWLPLRVWVKNRGKTRKELSAINGDAGRVEHEYPQLIFDQQTEFALVEKIVQFLQRNQIEIQASSLAEVTTKLLLRDDFQETLIEERDAFSHYSLVEIASADAVNMLNENSLLFQAILAYALQTFLLKLNHKNRVS